MAMNKKLTFVDGQMWHNGNLIAANSDEYIDIDSEKIADIIGSSGEGGRASGISYDNLASGLLADNVQDAIDEVHEEVEDRAGAAEGRLDVIENNIDGLVDTINMEVVPEELGDTIGDAINSVNNSLNNMFEEEEKEYNVTFVSGTAGTRALQYYIDINDKIKAGYTVHSMFISHIGDSSVMNPLVFFTNNNIYLNIYRATNLAVTEPKPVKIKYILKKPN